METEEIVMVAFTQNWADEFNYPIIGFFTKRFWNLLIFNRFLFEKALPDEQEFYFGTNEWFSLFVSEIFNEYIERQQVISPEDYKKISTLYSEIQGASKDLLGGLLDRLGDVYFDIENNPEHELAEYKENIERLFKEYEINYKQLWELQ